jgi:CBS domain-containing protein
MAGFMMELTRNLKEDTVARLEPAAPRQIDLESPVAMAVETMRKERVGCLLVCRDGKLVGVFTERDLLYRIVGAGRELNVPMRECMTPEPITIRRNDGIRTAIKKMQKGGYRHLPVVDDNDFPVGILSVKRIIRYLAEHFPGVYTLPPNPGHVPEAREGA